MEAEIKTKEPAAPEAMDIAMVQPIGPEQLRKFTFVLQKYKGKPLCSVQLIWHCSVIIQP